MTRCRSAMVAVLASVVLLGAAPLRAQVSIVDDRGRSVSLAQPPRRIVSLLPSLTETVCALQACGRLVGVDRYSNWPASVRDLPSLAGIEDTPIERLVGLKPDLVLAAVSSRAVDRLQALGLTVLAFEPQDWAGAQRAILAIARALGQAPAGPALVARIDARVAAAAVRVPAAWRGRAVYFEVSSEPYAASEASFLGQLLARLGLANIVPASLGSFPRLNPEYVLRAQPVLVMAGAAALKEMPGRPGWTELSALRRQAVCGFSPEAMDALVRPGPRLGDAADAVADCLTGIASLAP